jgi:ABC-type bacteriocin/lantibiotic exporter with double-glycine peptidase domain
MLMKKILPVKPFQETLNAGMCGPASLKTVLSYYGIEKSETELYDLCGTDPRLGTDDQGLKKAAQSCGMKVEITNESSFEEIEKWLDRDVPVIVDWFTRGRTDYTDSDVADGHYSVVVGLDEENIYLEDPEIGGMRTLDREDFLRVWFDFTGETIKKDELIIQQIIVVSR